MFQYSVIISCALLLIAFGDDKSYKEYKNDNCVGHGNDGQESVMKLVDVALDNAIRIMTATDLKTG